MELLNYFSFPIQSNIYGLSCLQTSDGTDRLLVATLERQLFCIENKQNKFCCREIHFTYIPNGANIISIDSFQRSMNGHDFVVGITFVKTDKESNEVSDDKTEGEKLIVEHYYFNIYASLVTLQDFDLEHIARKNQLTQICDIQNIFTLLEDCQTFEIEFVPYHLFHTDLYLDNRCEYREQVWILSGSDCCAHIFREDKEKQCFYEESAPTYFPELCDLPAIIMWFDIYNLKTNEGIKRLTAVGLENGVIRLNVVEFDVDINKHVISNSWAVEYDGPVLSVRLFTDQSNFVSVNTDFKQRVKTALKSQVIADTNIHLLVTNSIESSVVYRNVLINGLKKRLLLPNSRRCDSTITSCVADIDMDTNNEIAIGTYGHELIVYKYDSETDSYFLLWEKTFTHSLQSIAYIDLTGDGLKELVVLTVKGLFVLQHNLQNVIQLCHQKVKNLLKELDISEKE